MFRLDREKLGHPCDLCIHNRKISGTFGSEIAAQMYCKFTVVHAESKLKGFDSQNILSYEWFAKEGFLTKTTCTHFELNIDKLEKVVTKKLGIGVSGGTIGLITADGDVTLAYDPLWIVKNSVSTILKYENLARKYVTSVNGVIMSVNTLEYCKLSDERKCIMASGVWFSAMTLLQAAMNPGETPGWLSGNNGGDLMAVILKFLGHPTIQPGKDTNAGQRLVLQQALEVSERVCARSLIVTMKKH